MENYIPKSSSITLLNRANSCPDFSGLAQKNNTQPTPSDLFFVARNSLLEKGTLLELCNIVH